MKYHVPCATNQFNTEIVCRKTCLCAWLKYNKQMTTTMNKINEDLQRERDRCTFDVKEFTNIIDGGPQNTLKRREREKTLLSKVYEMAGDIPTEYLSYKEKYEQSVQRATMVFGLLREQLSTGSNLTDYIDILNGMLTMAPSLDGSPLGVHYMAFIPAFMSQGTEEQQAEWLSKSWNCTVIGSYAQTEMGHGTFIRGLETTVTYDPSTQEFIIHSPTLTSYKWWPGGLGQTANYCVLVAQLITKGECHGIHSFVVQLRDEETHMPLPGIKIGEIGVKMAMNCVNNGFLGFDNFRIPRKNMLMKHAQVLEDGTYVKSKNSKLNYGSMVFVRVVVVIDAANYAMKAVTIATRYSAVRRQSHLKEGEPECQILDFATQQHKLFIGIATSHALKNTATKLWDTYSETNKQLGGGNLERLAELHALACCLKAVSTSDTARVVESCRLACGGHGYMMSSNLPQTYCMASAACTYEGENTVLLLQTARYLVKTWRQMDSAPLTPTVAYLKATTAERYANVWDRTVDGIIKAFQKVAMRKIACCVEVITERVKSGMSYENAWNCTSVQLVAAAEIHCRVIIISSFHEEVTKIIPTVSPPARRMLLQLVEIYAVYWALEKVSDLLRYTSISKNDVDVLQRWYEQLLCDIRPNAVGLVDAFDIQDILLNSTLGSYDGRVYERLMEEAMKSPLNAEPVNQSFHKHLKPFMQGKL